MALAKLDTDVNCIISGLRDNHQATRIKLPPICESLPIDYHKLKELCAIQGLKNSTDGKSTLEAHEKFLLGFRQIFVKPTPIQVDIQHLTRPRRTPDSAQLNATGKSTGRTYTAQRSGKAVSPSVGESGSTVKLVRRKRSKVQISLAGRINELRNLLQKLPFERTAAENEQILHILTCIPDLSSRIEAPVLKELCLVAKLHVWKEANLTLFSHSALHVVLKGSVQPHSLPYLVELDEDFVSERTVSDDSIPQLGIGRCFGCFNEIKDELANSALTVETLQAHTEFMVISTSDYARVLEQLKQREELAKVNLLQSSDTFMLWSKQPLTSVASLIEWTSFAPNTVLASEGYVAPLMAVIKSGECHVLRLVDTSRHSLDSSKRIAARQVVMGKLGANDSFGEISVIEKEPISCSIVTASEVELACIYPERLIELDAVTLRLLAQSAESTFANLTQSDIYDEYIKQELKREWNEFKHQVVIDVINARGIRPGYGKWAK